MTAPAVTTDAIRVGDVVTGRNGLGGLFDLHVESIGGNAIEGPRYYGRVTRAADPAYIGQHWSFGEADLVERHEGGR